MKVELDIYSGRTNPVFELSQTQEKEFYKLLNSLPKSAAPSQIYDGTGYRGFNVIGVPGCKIVWGQLVDVGNKNLFDELRILEKFLVKAAEEHIKDTLYAVLLKETA